MASNCFTKILCVFSLLVVTAYTKPPNIVFMVADDYGWNDVGFRNPDMITPNIDKLAYEGVILNQSYVQPVCTPSRNAFMTGVYPFKAGLQHLVILPEQATCAPTNRTFLPQYLKKLGYATHALGKWHLGFCKWECTPTYRGFDSFYGFYNGQETYYNRTVVGGIDFRDDKKAVLPDVTKYSTYIYAERAKEKIEKHDQDEPLFMYFPFQSVHEPIEVPVSYENMYSGIKNEGRRKYCGMVTAMDDLVGNVTAALKENGMYDDTLFVFTADNGGWTTFHGNNYPLRGGKATVYEGGTRATAFITGAGLMKKGYTYNGNTGEVERCHRFEKQLLQTRAKILHLETAHFEKELLTMKLERLQIDSTPMSCSDFHGQQNELILNGKKCEGPSYSAPTSATSETDGISLNEMGIISLVVLIIVLVIMLPTAREEERNVPAIAPPVNAPPIIAQPVIAPRRSQRLRRQPDRFYF